MPASSLYAGVWSGNCWIVWLSSVTASRSRPRAMRIFAIAVSVLALGGWLAPGAKGASAASVAAPLLGCGAAAVPAPDLPLDAQPLDEIAAVSSSRASVIARRGAGRSAPRQGFV